MREMCWLKSIEVEDKKIVLKKGFALFGIYQSTFVFTLNSRFLCHTLKIFLCLLDNLTLHFNRVLHGFLFLFLEHEVMETVLIFNIR